MTNADAIRMLTRRDARRTQDHRRTRLPLAVLQSPNCPQQAVKLLVWFGYSQGNRLHFSTQCQSRIISASPNRPSAPRLNRRAQAITRIAPTSHSAQRHQAISICTTLATSGIFPELHAELRRRLVRRISEGRTDSPHYRRGETLWAAIFIPPSGLKIPRRQTAPHRSGSLEDLIKKGA